MRLLGSKPDLSHLVSKTEAMTNRPSAKKVDTRGVQGPASTDPPTRNRPNRRFTGGSKSTLRSVTDWQVKNPNSSVWIRVSKYFTRKIRTDRIIYNKKKSRFDMPKQPMPSKSEMPARDFPHTFPT